MPYQIQTDGRYLRVTYSGHVTQDEVINSARDVASLRATLAQVPDQLMDFSGIGKQDTRYELLQPIGTALRKQIFPNAFRYAMVASTPVSYGIARMFQTLVSHPQIDARVFKSADEAEAWLAEKPGGAGLDHDRS